MKIEFYKYHGAGNDFIMMNGFDSEISLSKPQVAFLCTRHTGIGADGLIVLKPHPDLDFQMDYYNADGGLASLCGNGSRCAMAFAKDLGLIDSSARFLASDGIHEADFEGNRVSIHMGNVSSWEEHLDGMVIDTGSPHFVKEVNNINQLDVVACGRKIRYSETFQTNGINVNFIAENEGELYLRTYERGVENETLACGTGAVATALALNLTQGKPSPILLHALGGDLEIRFNRNGEGFSEIYLVGPAEYVFKGSIVLE